MITSLLKSTTALTLGILVAMPVAATAQQAQPEQPQETQDVQPEATPEAQPQDPQPEPGAELPVDDAATAEDAVATQCQQQLTGFAQQLNEEQFWITGWGNTPGFGFGGMDPAAMPADPAAEPVEGVGAAPGVAAYADLYGFQSPRGQVQHLYAAAQVFAAQGNDEGCEYVLNQLVATYEQYRTELTDAGVEPAQIVDWRQEQIALAEPIAESEGTWRYRLDHLTGTDVRSREDENLGSVSDVVLDPRSGDISHLIVARGGFLGFGEELVAVPWNQFHTTPGLNTLVLDVTAEQLAGAPSVEANFWTDDQAYGELTQQSDAFWQQPQ